MAPRSQIVNASIPASGIYGLRSLKLGDYIEAIVTPKIGSAFKAFMDGVAKKAAADWPIQSRKSANELAASARVRYGRTLDTVRGYFSVSVPIAANEYGTNPVVPVTAKKLAIPILDGLYPDGTPKRLGPNSWRSLGTFVFTSKKTDQQYIAYRVGRKLKILYVLVDRTKGLKELRKIRNAYDARLPDLYAAITVIMQEAVVETYNLMFIQALNSIDKTLKMNRLPSVIPSAPLHAERLTPKY